MPKYARDIKMNQTKKIKVFQNQDYKELGILYGLFFEDLNHAADGVMKRLFT